MHPCISLWCMFILQLVDVLYLYVVSTVVSLHGGPLLGSVWRSPPSCQPMRPSQGAFARLGLSSWSAWQKAFLMSRKLTSRPRFKDIAFEKTWWWIPWHRNSSVRGAWVRVLMPLKAPPDLYLKDPRPGMGFFVRRFDTSQAAHSTASRRCEPRSAASHVFELMTKLSLGLGIALTGSGWYTRGPQNPQCQHPTKVNHPIGIQCSIFWTWVCYGLLFIGKST